MCSEEEPLEDELIDIIIDSGKEKFNITTFKHGKFLDVATSVCEMAGWDLSKTRFLFNGDRLENDKTFSENEVDNHALIDVMFEMVGGKGPTEDEMRMRILKMLEEADTATDDEQEETDNSCDATDASTDESHEKDTNSRLYEELKMKLRDGTLELDGSKDQDQKLLFLLETEHLQPYELLRLKNVYTLWEQNKEWREDLENDLVKKKTVKKKIMSQEHASKQVLKRSKRNSQEISKAPVEFVEEITPIKRQKLLATFGLNTPSPLKKNCHIDEMEMKRISVSVHLWAERKMGGVDFLHNARLESRHFEDIQKFTGPTSKWKLMKNRTTPQLRSLWRNTFEGKHSYRGDKKTGFENEFQRHSSIRPFCPFSHCSSGMMSQMDIDLIVLTPTRSNLKDKEGIVPSSSRQLFVDSCEKVDKVLDDENTVNLWPKLHPVEGSSGFLDPLIDENEQQEAKGELDQTTMSCVIQEEDNTLNESSGMNFDCKIDNCGKNFQTFFGLERHKIIKHSEIKLGKEESKCQICEKSVIYLDQHMRAKHSEVQKPKICEVCLLEVNSNMQKHRKACTKCRYCDYQNIIKARLLNHIKKCDKNPTKLSPEGHDEEPLDLRSPLKMILPDTDAENVDLVRTGVLRKEILMKEGLKNVIEASNNATVAISNKDVPVNLSEQRQIKDSNEKVDFERGRTKYPFDDQTTEEDYYSELDIDDTELFTVERRKKKDQMELELRKIDDLQNSEIEGDNFIVDKFEEFMRNKRSKDDNEGGYSKQTEPTTIKAYSNVVKTDILKAFHKLVEPFDARWLIDCKTPKVCKFEGEERLHVRPEEPIYMTSRILQEAMKRHEASGNSGNQKKKVIAAFNQLMAFIELHFTLKLNAYGVEVLNKVITYHQGVKSFISGTSQWKKNNDEEKEGFEKSKLLNDYENPNKDVEVLDKYKEYVKSEERILKISKLLEYSHPDAEAPPPSLMTEFGINVMEEIVGCTGCRPKVARHLMMGAVVDAKAGFNPYKTSNEDKTEEEDLDGDKIYRRVNPNLPPKEKACIHQIKNKSAICPESCELQCIPDGVNIWITWDKTQSTKGPYFLHIPTPIKKLMDRYDIIRTNFFKNKTPKFAASSSWMEDPKTPFFLNSACGSFPSLNLRKLSNLLGTDVTAYSFRKMVSTWALTHKSEEIRAAEEEALQHSLHVAKERYHQAKQVQPQNFTQTYTQEENLFPESFRRELDKGKSDIELRVAKKQEERAKVRFSNLVKEKVLSKKSKYEHRPLGPRNAILESDRQEFEQIFQDATGSELKGLVTTLKPVQFRDLVVREVCSSSGESGDKLRRIWSKLYEGDLQHGIRDIRRQAKENNWPLRKQNPGRKDRNSWIAHNLRKSCQAVQKFEDT